MSSSQPYSPNIFEIHSSNVSNRNTLPTADNYV